jgi:hypothetical protein
LSALAHRELTKPMQRDEDVIFRIQVELFFYAWIDPHQ